MSKFHAEEQLLEDLKNGDQSKWKAFYSQVRSPFVGFFGKSTSMQNEDLLELFQEAMAIFFQNVTRKKLKAPLRSSLQTYIIGIGRNLVLKRGGKVLEWDEKIPDSVVLPEVEQNHKAKESAALVNRLLSQVGEKCRELLEMVFIKGFALEAIASRMQVPAGTLRKRKFDCLKKLRDQI